MTLPHIDQPAPDVLAVRLDRPTSGWRSASQSARLLTAFWYALTVLSA